MAPCACLPDVLKRGRFASPRVDASVIALTNTQRVRAGHLSLLPDKRHRPIYAIDNGSGSETVFQAATAKPILSANVHSSDWIS
jgi:hypothetical protein